MWRIALIGGAGGVLPTLVDKVEAWNEGVVTVWLGSAPNVWIAILVALIPMIVYFIIGAIVAYVYEDQSMQKALLLGIGAPAFIVASVGNTGDQPEQIKVTRSEGLSLVSSAYAQFAGREAEVYLDVGKFTSGNGCDTCTVTFWGADGKPIATQPLATAPSATIEVPDTAKVLEFRGMDTNPAQVDLGEVHQGYTSGTGKITLDVDVNRSYWNDFNRSLGAKGVQPYNFDVQLAR